MRSGGHRSSDTQVTVAPELSAGHVPHDTHDSFARASTLAQTKHRPLPGSAASAPDLNGGHSDHDTHVGAAPDQLNGGQVSLDAHPPNAPEDIGGGHPAADTQPSSASSDWILLRLYADLVDDSEKFRIATENRLRSLRDVKGLSGSSEEKRLAGIVSDLKGIERVAVRELERRVATHPLGDWVKANKGIGLKTVGRLLGLIGDPTWYIDQETREVIPRTVSKLWAYCGGRPDQKRRKGEQSNWNSDAKMRVHLLAESCMKQRCKACREAGKQRKDAAWEPPPADCSCERDGFVWRAIYDRERIKWAERDTSDAHKQNHALRVTGKEILKSMWKFRRGHAALDAHPVDAPPNLQRGQVETDAHSGCAASNGDGHTSSDIHTTRAVTEVSA